MTCFCCLVTSSIIFDGSCTRWSWRPLPIIIDPLCIASVGHGTFTTPRSRPSSDATRSPGIRNQGEMEITCTPIENLTFAPPASWDMVFDLKDLPAVFPLLGLLFTLYYVWGVLDFIWFHYLRPTSWTRLLHGAKPYALITGATDGIGRSTAKELYVKGFNLILHGRNEEKMKEVVEEVKAADPTSGLDVEYFIADVGQPDVDFEGIARRFEDLNITLFVNNVGASFPSYETYVPPPSPLALRV